MSVFECRSMRGFVGSGYAGGQLTQSRYLMADNFCPRAKNFLGGFWLFPFFSPPAPPVVSSVSLRSRSFWLPCPPPCGGLRPWRRLCFGVAPVRGLGFCRSFWLFLRPCGLFPSFVAFSRCCSRSLWAVSGSCGFLASAVASAFASAAGFAPPCD